MTSIIRCIRAVVSTKTLLLHLVRTTTTTTTSATEFKSTVCVTLLGPPAEGGVGSARRRTDRQLRAFRRHEQLTVRMESWRRPSTTAHSPRGLRWKGRERRTSTRRTTRHGDRSDLLPRTRPGVLEEPGPQWVDAALSCRAASVPSLDTLSGPGKVSTPPSAFSRWSGRRWGGRRRRSGRGRMLHCWKRRGCLWSGPGGRGRRGGRRLPKPLLQCPSRGVRIRRRGQVLRLLSVAVRCPFAHAVPVPALQGVRA